jgi:predicted transport protein
MKQLLAVLQQSQSKLDRFRKDGLKETPTRVIFVDPLLDALGWNVKDPDEVQLEYPTVDGKSVDYALKLDCKTVMLVEAKPLTDSLTDVKDITQTTGYAANDGIVWCILTNGVRWRVYRSIEQCPAPEKLMFEVSYDPAHMDGLSLQQVAEHFQRFSREQMAAGVLDDLGEQMFADGKVRKALGELATNPPNTLLKIVRMAAGDTALKPQTVRESLARVLSPFVDGRSATSRIRSTVRSTSRTSAAKKSWATRRAAEGKSWGEDFHTRGRPQEVVELYRRLDQICVGLDPGNVERRFKKMYVAWSKGKHIFCSAHLQQGGLRIWLKLDHKQLGKVPAYARDVSKIGHWGVGDLELAVTNAQQLSEVQQLIRQSFDQK